MTTKLNVTITVNETKLSPARVVEEMVKGFVFLREGYFGVPESDLALEIDTLTVRQPKRERHSRHVEKPDPAPLAIDWPSVRVDSEHEEDVRDGRAYCGVCGWVDELDLVADVKVIADWHGDSFE